MRADILVFEDETHQSAALQTFLESFGCTVCTAHNFAQVETKVAQRQFDLLILDQLRCRQQTEVLSLMKDLCCDTYLLSILKDSTALDRVQALESGADDCLSHPYHPRELILRLEKLLQRKHNSRSDTVNTKYFSLNVKSGDLACPWGKVGLRKKEFLILSVLIQHKNHVVPKEKMIERVWGIDETPIMSTIDVHVRRIRLKIKDREKKIIKTSYGVGYMFCEE